MRAIELRKQGRSIKEIAKIVGIPTGTISRWVRNIILSEEQLRLLEDRNPTINGKMQGAKTTKKNAKIRRDLWQEEGREKAKANGLSLFTAGCMLYWAEGHKRNNKNTISFVNSDINMLILFKKFLNECLNVSDDKIGISINTYTDLVTIDDCKRYWTNSLSLSMNNIKSVTCDKRPKNTQQKRNGLLKYGTIRMTVHSTRLIQQIYGAIKELCSFENDNWQ